MYFKYFKSNCLILNVLNDLFLLHFFTQKEFSLRIYLKSGNRRVIWYFEEFYVIFSDLIILSQIWNMYKYKYNILKYKIWFIKYDNIFD